MPSTDSGLKDLSWADKDVGVAVANDGQDDASSAFVDLLDGTSGLLPDAVNFNFAITVASAGFNMKIYAVFSEDGVNDPPDGDAENRKIIIASLTGPATLTRSNIYSIPVLGRHFRLSYFNDGSGASVTISSRFAASFLQSFSA